MSKRLKKHANTLRFLATCDKHTSKSILRSAQPELLACVSDICHNILNGRVELSPKERKGLAKYKASLRKIANRKTTQKTKRELIQKGGFLNTLLGPLLSNILVPLTKNLLGK